MANTVKTRSIADGERNAIIHCYIKSDGTTGELSNEVVFDYSGSSLESTSVKIGSVNGCLLGFTATIKFDGASDEEAIVLPKDKDFSLEFNGHLIGVTNNATSPTGDITITTSDFVASNANHGFLVIEVVAA